MLGGSESYEGRGQTSVKHDILQGYLERFAHIVGFRWQSITYVDGFSGSWRNKNEDLSDTSFAVALKKLRLARETLLGHGRDLKIRCVFVEKDDEAYRQLEKYAHTKADEAEILTIHGEFEKAVPQILEFIKQGGDTFPFILIDPTGSSGFAMKAIAPLLSLKPGEVLINFMLEFIRRYIEQEGLRNALTQLYGTDKYHEDLASLSGIDRDDAITDKYCKCLESFCNYTHVLRASVMHPDQDRLYFQLIYATRDPKGVEVFKETESKAMKVQEDLRAQEEKAKKTKGGQSTFLDYEDPPVSSFYNRLRDRYIDQSNKQVLKMLCEQASVSYDQLWLVALKRPLVWKSDLDGWLKHWLSEKKIEWLGRKPSERSFKRNSGHVIERLADATLE
jgi:three-Cys-motif partner protein